MNQWSFWKNVWRLWQIRQLLLQPLKILCLDDENWKPNFGLSFLPSMHFCWWGQVHVFNSLQSGLVAVAVEQSTGRQLRILISMYVCSTAKENKWNSELVVCSTIIWWICININDNLDILKSQASWVWNSW